jgi:hypothetical protein
LILGIVLTIIGGVGTLNMGSLTYDYIVVTSMGFITPSTLLPSLIFFDALALAALIGGVMIIFSSRPRPAQTTVTPIQRLRKRRTTSATSTSKRYSAQFRAEAVRMVVADQKTIAEVARNLAVSPSTLRRWVASQRSADSGHASSST